MHTTLTGKVNLLPFSSCSPLTLGGVMIGVKCPDAPSAPQVTNLPLTEVAERQGPRSDQLHPRRMV